MSYDGKVVLGESVDKLLLQSQINGFGELVKANGKEYGEFFNGIEERLQNSIYDWSSKFFEEWEVTKINWPIGIEEDDNGKNFVSSNECHDNFFEFKFVNHESSVGFFLKFNDLSLELGLEAFDLLKLEELIFEIRVSYMKESTNFDQVVHRAKLSEFIEFLKKNFDYFKALLQDCVKQTELKVKEYNHTVEKMTENLYAAIDSLKALEKQELINMFFKACREKVEFEMPRQMRVSTKAKVIAKSVSVERVHANRRFVDVEVEELDLSEQVSYTKRLYKRVFIRTMFGFDLTDDETLKLIGNDL